MTVIYAINVKNLPLADEFVKKVSKRRQEFISRVKNESAKKLCLGAGLLLAKFVGTDEQTDKKGKPFVAKGPCFSVSHSHDIAILAVSENPIGADIELMDKTDISKLAKRSMTDGEFSFIMHSADSVKEFYRLWTKKESYVKMLGIGFEKMPENTDVLNVSEYNFYTAELEEYMLSICCSSNIEEKITFFEA